VAYWPFMEAGVEGLIRAGRFERSADRATWRNGYRERSLDTLNLTVPKLSAGAYFPGFLEPRRLSALLTSLVSP
jgi:putative transposase